MGSPTYMGSVSWQFKKFADASSKAWFTQKWKDKIFAGFTNSATMNDDKLSTLHYLFTLAMQHSGIWGGTGLMPSNSKAAQRNDVNYVGSFSGAMMQSPSDASAEEVIRATWRRRGCSASASPQSRSSCVAKRLRVTARPRFHAAGTVEVIDEPDHFDDSLRQA
jgi:multimeric flavodoxin WrbA